MMARREFPKQTGIAAATQSALRDDDAEVIAVDPEPPFAKDGAAPSERARKRAAL